MPREIIRPEYGQPVVFKLGHAPTQVEGIRGLQWRYFVNEDSAMLYLDEPAHAAVQATQAQPGAEICLRKERVGRSTHWAADVIEDEPVIVDGEILSTSQQATRARYEERRDAVHEPALAAAVVKSNGKPNGQAHVNGNGNGHHAPPPATPPQALVKETPPHRPSAKVLAMALFAAIDAAKLAQDYALSQGMKVQFDTGDIRAMAATLYIEQRKESR